MKDLIIPSLRRSVVRLFNLIALFTLVFFFTLPAHSLNDSPQTFTLDGKLYLSGSTEPLLDPAAKITIQILDPAAQCLLYEEQQTINTVTSEGYFNINIGSSSGAAKRTVNDPGRTMNQIFQNASNISANNAPGQTCASGLFTPTAGAIRYFRVIVTPSSTNQADTLTPDIVIDSVPNAMVAQSVQGLERTSILQTNNSGTTVLTQANLEALFTTPAYANLQSILGGNFIKTDSSGASLPSYATDPAGVSNGDIWFDSTTGELKYKSAAGVQTVGASGGGGGVSSLTVSSSMSINGTVAGTISGPGTIDLSDTGVTAGTYTKMTVDAKGRVTAGTISLVEGDIPNLTSAGKVSGNTITSGTISGSAAINTSGNLVSTGTVSGLTVQATNLRIYNGSNYIQMVAPALGGNVNLTWPATDGNAGEYLKTDGAGVLSWSTASTTSTDVTTALGYTPLNSAALFAGDISGPSTAISVDKIKGKAVSAGSADGQMMIYNGTSWVNSVMSGDATMANTGVLTLNKVPVAKGGTNAVAFGNNKIISSNGTGSALQDFSCPLNQVISFDASGYAVCASVSALASGLSNGGNSYASDISVGTNDGYAFSFKANNSIAMTISQSGNVGIGTTAPSSILDINGSITQRGMAAPALAPAGQGRIYFDSGDNKFKYSVNGGAYAEFGSGGGGSAWTISGSDIHYTAGKVGVGISTPTTQLDVQGQMKTSTFDNTAVTTIDWNKGNIQYTTDSCQAYTFDNVQDGASYTFTVKGATAAQCTFTAAGVTFHYTPSNGPTNAGTHTVYTFFRSGNDAYVSWVTGL